MLRSWLASRTAAATACAERENLFDAWPRAYAARVFYTPNGRSYGLRRYTNLTPPLTPPSGRGLEHLAVLSIVHTLPVWFASRTVVATACAVLRFTLPLNLPPRRETCCRVPCASRVEPAGRRRLLGRSWVRMCAARVFGMSGGRSAFVGGGCRIQARGIITTLRAAA